MMMEARPVWMFTGAPMLLMFLVAAGIILYGLTQPRYRMASLSALGLAFGLFTVAGLFFFRSSDPVFAPPVTVGPSQGSVSPNFVVTRNVGFGIGAAEIGLLLVVAVVGVLTYGATQPRYRAASVTTAGIGLALLVLGGATWVKHPASRVENGPTLYGQGTNGRVQIIREQEWVSRAVAGTPESQTGERTATPETAEVESPPAIASGIELFEGTRRTGTSLKTLPDWITAPVESDPTRMMMDSGPRASFEECQSELMSGALAHLQNRLALLHPQTSGWQPSEENIRWSGAISKRVQETQSVRIDVADSVIREPLYREYWLVESDDQVLDRLLAAWRPAASQERATLLAKGLGLVTLLFGSVAFAIRMAGSRSRPIPV